MSSTTLAGTLFSRTRSTVFAELFRNHEGSYLREMERVTGINSRQLIRELHTLRDAGIVSSDRVGNVVVYRFNPECPIYEDLQAIIRKTVGLADITRGMLSPFKDQIGLAYIFGSYARGEQRPDSDVDLLVVGSATRRQLSSAIRQTETILRRAINTVFYTLDEYQTQLTDSDSFVAKVHNGSRMNLIVDCDHEPTGTGVER